MVRIAIRFKYYPKICLSVMFDKLADGLNDVADDAMRGAESAYAEQVESFGDDSRGQAMMGRIIGLVVAVSVGLVITFNLLPTVFEQWDVLQTDGDIPANLEGIVELVPVFGILAIALVFLGALMYAIRDASGGTGGF